MMLNQDSITTSLLNCYQKHHKPSASRRETHNLLTQIVADLAAQFGLRAVGKYPLHCSDGTQRFIDVVWLSDSRPIATFEVDSSLRTRSLKKLLNAPAKFRFWVYYGRKDPTSFVANLDSENCITVICTHRAPQKSTGSRPIAANAPVSQATTNLLAVDHHIRQAIQHCWSALPTGERSLKRVDQEITRRVQRTLGEIDQDLFTFSEKSEFATSNFLARNRQEYPRTSERWTEKEDQLLQQKFSGGASVRELARFFQRHPSTIVSHLRKLGNDVGRAG